MPVFMMRYEVNGKFLGHPVEADTKEQAQEKFEKILPDLAKLDLRSESPPPPLPPDSPSAPPLTNKKLNGKKFLSLEFQCSSCGTILVAVFKDGYLQIDPCPTCLGELESMVAASKRFLERKK